MGGDRVGLDTQPYLNQERAVLIVGKFDQGYM